MTRFAFHLLAFALGICGPSVAAAGEDGRDGSGGTAAPATVVEIRLEQVARDAPPIGVNDLGDSGGIRFSAGNLIPGSGFEPISIRRYRRVIEHGDDKGYAWITVDGGGVTEWDLVTTGFLNGARYRLYRIVDAAGEPLPVRDGYLDLSRADRFVRVGEGIVPEAGAPGLPLGGFVDEPGEQRIYLEGTSPLPWDYIFFEKRTVDPDPAWSHPRLDDSGHSDEVAETWRPGWGHEDARVTLERRPHGAPTPPEMRFPGETAYRVTTRDRGAQAIHGPYIFFPVNDNPEGDWYGTLEPGETYRYEAWMRQEGLGGGGRVELGFFSVYDTISRTFTVGDAWQRVGFTFTAPERPTHDGWHGGPAIRFTGPGTLEIDSIRLFRIDSPEQADELFVPSPMMVDELLASQPTDGEKGILRAMYVMLNDASMASLLSVHADATIVYDWYVAVQAAPNMSLPGLFDYALRTGTSPADRMKPWLNVSTRASEEEWEMLMEYLAAPIDPEDPDEVAAKPWAHLRYLQRGVATPWTDEFERIHVEFANETWHNGAVESQWDGWHRDNWVHHGSHEFGLWVDFIGSRLEEHSPAYRAAREAGTIELVMGSNYDDYAEAAIPYLSLETGTPAVGHTTYVGPRWENEEERRTEYSDEGVQATLLGHAAGLADELDRYRRMREELAAAGYPYSLYAYEGGPSGYALPHTAPDEEVEIAERYGKSQAMAVASLDAWLGAYRAGFSEMAFLGFQQGEHWSSHTSIRQGFRRHVPWLAMTMRNRYASGTMIEAQVRSGPTLAWGGEEVPLVGAYAFRDGARLAVFVLNRRLDGPAAVELRLPADPIGEASLYALDEDPRATNRHALDVAIRHASVRLGKESTVTVPAGSIHLYVMETDLEDEALPPPAPRAPQVTPARGRTTVRWNAVAGAREYAVLRGEQPHFAIEDATVAGITDELTFVDEDAPRLGRYYYRVAAFNEWGRGYPSPAVGSQAAGRTP